MTTSGIEMRDLAIFGGVMITLALLYFIFFANTAEKKLKKRIKNLRNRKNISVKAGQDIGTLRRKTQQSVPVFGQAVKNFNVTMLNDRIQRAGKEISAEKYLFLSLLLLIVTTLMVKILTGKTILLGIFIGIIIAVGVPHFVLSYLIGKRIKLFTHLFPDAIDLIVRGLRSGLPVAESINIVSTEIQDPVGCTFRTMGEQMKLGVTLEKALYDTARKLGITEFNFFVTSIVLQRETGGNLSEILSNLSDVLRKRFMMRMKIKALSSEARASAMIVGSLPFVVMLALFFMQPDYLEPLFNDYRGNIAGIGAAMSMALGITIMMKMARFEI